MVGVVQLVERQVVILNVAGSSPVTPPKDHAGRSRLGVTGACNDGVATPLTRRLPPRRPTRGRATGSHWLRGLYRLLRRDAHVVAVQVTAQQQSPAARRSALPTPLAARTANIGQHFSSHT